MTTEEMLHPVTFTQFLMPDGRQTEVTIGRPQEIATMATQIKSRGWKFEIEMLRTGEISMEICGEEESLASEICLNGPPVVAAVDKLIRDGWAILNSPNQ